MLRTARTTATWLVVALVIGSSAASAQPRHQNGFPVTLTSANGKLTLAAKPSRIISLSPTATESLFAIGAGKQVIAVDDQSNYPASAPKSKLSGYTPNAEAIAAYKPDLVVLQYDANKIVEALAKLKIPVLMQNTATSLTDAYGQITVLGVATGNTARASSLVTKMKTQIATLVKSVPHRATPLTVYEEIEPDLYAPTSKTFIGSIYTLLGLKNIADAADKTHTGFPQLSAEYIVAADPDLIVLADTKCCGQNAKKVQARSGWGTITAVKNGTIVAIDDDVASRWGPRVIDFVREVVAWVKKAQA